MMTPGWMKQPFAPKPFALVGSLLAGAAPGVGTSDSVGVPDWGGAGVVASVAMVTAAAAGQMNCSTCPCRSGVTAPVRRLTVTV